MEWTFVLQIEMKFVAQNTTLKPHQQQIIKILQR
jgi:hypothetical protein